MSVAAAELAYDVPRVVGSDLLVPLVTGGHVEYANLDHAASAPCLVEVQEAVNEFLPWYASVHRGAGYASQVSSRLFEAARDKTRRFVGAHPRDAVVFTRHTTEAMNLLAHCLPRGAAVVCFDTEHHAALLPWHGPHVRRLPVPYDRAEAVAVVDAALAACPEGPRLLVLSGASNVTGEVLPVRQLARVARRHGARVALDAAQLAPHRPVSLRELDVDYLALSGHKLYAPFGAGALVGRSDWLRTAPPYLKGGGASARVTHHNGQLSVGWQGGPQRQEAGSPNVVGAHALAVACDTLSRHWPAIRAHEAALLDRLTRGLAAVPGAAQLRMFPGAPDRVGTVSFVIAGFDPGWLAAVLAAEHGIGVRDGAFCAHLATRELVARTGVEAGGVAAVRASVGLGSSAGDVDRLVGALRDLVSGGGAQWDYRRVEGRWQPVPDPRPWPGLAGSGTDVRQG